MKEGEWYKGFNCFLSFPTVSAGWEGSKSVLLAIKLRQHPIIDDALEILI